MRSHKIWRVTVGDTLVPACGSSASGGLRFDTVFGHAEHADFALPRLTKVEFKQTLIAFGASKPKCVDLDRWRNQNHFPSVPHQACVVGRTTTCCRARRPEIRQKPSRSGVSTRRDHSPAGSGPRAVARSSPDAVAMRRRSCGGSIGITVGQDHAVAFPSSLAGTPLTARRAASFPLPCATHRRLEAVLEAPVVGELCGLGIDARLQARRDRPRRAPWYSWIIGRSTGASSKSAKALHGPVGGGHAAVDAQARWRPCLPASRRASPRGDRRSGSRRSPARHARARQGRCCGSGRTARRGRADSSRARRGQRRPAPDRRSAWRSDLSASGPVSAACLMMPSPSRSHCTAASGDEDRAFQRVRCVCPSS